MLDKAPALWWWWCNVFFHWYDRRKAIRDHNLRRHCNLQQSVCNNRPADIVKIKTSKCFGPLLMKNAALMYRDPRNTYANSNKRCSEEHITWQLCLPLPLMCSPLISFTEEVFLVVLLAFQLPLKMEGATLSWLLGLFFWTIPTGLSPLVCSVSMPSSKLLSLWLMVAAVPSLLYYISTRKLLFGLDLIPKVSQKMCLPNLCNDSWI